MDKKYLFLIIVSLLACSLILYVRNNQNVKKINLSIEMLEDENTRLYANFIDTRMREITTISICQQKINDLALISKTLDSTLISKSISGNSILFYFAREGCDVCYNSTLTTLLSELSPNALERLIVLCQFSTISEFRAYIRKMDLLSINVFYTEGTLFSDENILSSNNLLINLNKDLIIQNSMIPKPGNEEALLQFIKIQDRYR